MKKTEKAKILSLLSELDKAVPIAQHISTALSDYGDFWGMTDREFLYALQKYKSVYDLDILELSPDEYVESIIEDGKHLFDPQIEDEEE